MQEATYLLVIGDTAESGTLTRRLIVLYLDKQAGELACQGFMDDSPAFLKSSVRGLAVGCEHYFKSGNF
jgi:hypothetical protein